ncbi:non-ribosomal peptide synthetase [Xanthomonas sp. 3075]|uniref:amino acid adenylation domain-containing protein n=1 Tax=Xanthomonas sp. 3075 TaxID=3035315 RepID=UPI0016105DA9|nr:non-ribosomal peptide synthetase [Xanthomonas sp. 3075]MBB4133176.1 amino acid adenylation domain-containing protein [Xanthomonas sp. 3075]
MDKSAKTLPASFVQKRMWLLARLDPQASITYHIANGVRLIGELDIHALHAALDRIVARHEVLRTSLVEVNGQIRQRIQPATGFPLVHQDLSDCAADPAAVARIVQQEARQPFDLELGAPVRGRLLQLTAHEHVLLLTFHHIACDGWSIGVLLRELEVLYGAFIQQQPDPLPPLSIQYADYAIWQSEQLQGDTLETQLRFWTAQLAGAPSLLALPTDHPRPAMQDYRGSVVEVLLPPALGQRLNALARRHGCSLFVTLLAGWALLLARISATNDVVIGTPVAGRTHPDLEPLIGCFINTLALRLTVSGTPSVAQWLAYVRDVVLNAQDHQALPFERLVEALQPNRSLSHTPVFQTLFSLDGFSGSQSLHMPGLQLEPLADASDMCGFDLVLAMQESPAGLGACIKYPIALFERSTIEGHLAQFISLLHGMVADDNLRVDRLPLLSAPACEQWLQTRALTQRVFADDRCLHSVFEQQVAQAPRAIAVVHDDVSISYAELDIRANQLAHYLIAQGIGPEDRVALYLQRGIDLIVAILAVLKAGAAYLPLDPAYPAQRLAFMLDDAQPRLLLAHRALAATLPTDSEIATVLLDADPVWAQQPTHAPQRSDVLPQHPAYVIYTSGSTGTPKGVVVAHAQVVRLLHATRACVAPSAEDVWTLFHSCAFDFSVWELWGALAHGGRLVVVPQHTARDPAAFHALLCQQRVSVLNQTPSAFQALLDAQRESPLQHNLRLVIFGGEALQPAALAPWFAQHGQRTALLNMYGITETTVHVTAHALTADDAQRPGHSPIGAPLADLRAYVLADDGQCLPVGVAGELHVAGAGLARGYLGRPGLTAERFVPDPFAEQAGERMYRSGDVARWRTDGSLEYLGRNDEQVKIRGFRIELGEIQAALRGCDGVRQAVVVVREDNTGDKRLVAYLVGDTDITLNADALRTQLGARLPDYMLPAAYMQLDALPLTANGKLDRRALPAPDADALAVQAYVAPEGELETQLATLWSELLGVERIGRYDDFFALGGHSLLAVQLLARVRQRLGLDLSLAGIFAHARLADLAAALTSGSVDTPPAVVPCPQNGPLPLSFAQQRLWFIDMHGQIGTAYSLAYALRLRGSLEVTALGRALERIVERHQALRTCFVTVDGQPQQLIQPADRGFALVHHDLSADSDPLQAAYAHVESEAQAPFDLASGPLLRSRLLRLGEHDHILLLTVHHIVADAWSGAVLVNELSALYSAFVQGLDDPLPPLPIQYADFAIWQRRWIAGERLQRQLAHWVEHLRGAPALLDLPTDYPRPSQPDHRGEVLPFRLDAAQSAALKALAQRHGATLFMVILAAWAALLSRLSGQREVVIGTPISNRHQAELESLIGLFVDSLALRIDLSKDPSVAALLAQTRATALAAQACQDIPFEHVVEALNPVRSNAHNPVFQVMFAWQNAPEGELALPGLSLESLERSGRSAQFDLELSMQEDADCIVGSLGFATALFARSTIQRHIRQLLTLLGRMASADSAPLSTLSAIEPQELARLQDFNATDIAMADGAGVQTLFERHAEQNGSVIAVVDAQRSLSYAELDAQANQLARYLIDLGVGPDRRVALCLGRSIELIVAMLAILKAGGAYVPLDPAYPPQRLAFMLADSAPCVLLTDAQGASQLGTQAGIPVLLLDQSDPDWAQPPHTAPRVPALQPQHLAYVIYTSGSTGTPKGVAVDHGGLRNYCVAAATRYGLRSGDRVLQCSSPSFDIAVDEIFATLSSGATLVLLPGQRLPAIAEFVRVIEQQRISVLNLPTAYWHAWMAEQAHSVAPLPATLRLVVCGGEALNPAHVQGWHTLADERVQLINAYGPSETVSGVSFGTVLPGQAVHIGGPIANVRLHVLDRRQQPLPIGVNGQLHIAGAQLARGYLGRPDLTAERFVPDPFAPLPGARMYRSGDLVRWREDGTLLFVGRDDQQVKLRGFRIEPSEIEAVLRTAPGVHDAAVLVREDRTGERSLVAYVVTSSLQVDAVRAHLAARLPDYMVPASYVRLDALPLTANGKLDRQALPAPDAERSDPAGASPQGANEQALAQLWCELLAIDQVNRDDDFFDLGGHSLLAVQLIARVRDSLGVELQIGDVFTHTQLQALARCLDRSSPGEAQTIVAVDRSTALPLSFAQQRLWFLDRFDPHSQLAYLMPGGVRLSGPLNRTALRRALDRIVARHESLRTVFGVENDAPVQLIADPETGFSLDCIDLTTLPDPEAAAREHAFQEATTGFDLQHGPLLRGRLLDLAEHEHLLLVTMHHIVSDGWSMGVFIRELGALYSAFVQGRDNPLPPLQVQYADYSSWQRRRISGQTLQRQRDFWGAHLQGAPTLLELPTDRPRPARQDYTGDMVHFSLDPAHSAALKQLGQRHGTTVYMTLLAAWSVLLSRLSGQSDVVIGTPVANRTHAELEPLIGFFVNTQALRVDLSSNPTVARLLAQVRQTALAAQSHQDLPFEQLIETLNPDRNLGAHPLFQVMLSWENLPEPELSLPGLRLQGVDLQLPTIKFDLSMGLQEHDGCIVGTLGYASALFDRSTIQRHVAQFVQILQAISAGDQQRVTCLPLLPPAQQRQLLEMSHARPARTLAQASLHALFAQQAALTPDAPAIVSQAATLSYAELLAQSQRLAQQLMAAGVHPGDRVAVVLPRSAQLIVAQLAVLHCGAAYVPLDAEHPGERLVELIGHCAARAVLSDSSIALQDLQLPRLDLDCLAPADQRQAMPIAVAAHSPAYVIYTSGSTGTPKGVVVAHEAVIAFAMGGGHVPIQADDRVAFLANPAFDASTFEVWVALLHGAAIVVVEQHVLLDPPALAEHLASNAVSILHLTAGLVPSYWRALAGCLPKLRCLLTGGDRVDARAIGELLAQAPPQRLLHCYGPTETTVFGVLHPLAAVEPGAERLPLGRPLPGTCAYVLDRHGQLAPIGSSGELHLAGAQLAQGYLDLPGLTAERFIPDPFATAPGQRMYRTGDLARWRNDGTLDFLGRNDDQVKIRGFRVEPADVEAALRDCPGVREAIVLTDMPRPGERRLVAYVVASAVTPEALRAMLSAKLPAYMVPAAYVCVDALPLTANGKLDRKRLPAPGSDDLASDAYAAPQGLLEQTLASLWCELIGVARVGRHDNFFALGGHSLLAVTLIERLRRHGWHVDVRSLFSAPTLAGLAAGLQTAVKVVIPPNLIAPDCGRITPELLPLAALTQAEIDLVVASVDGGAANVQDIYPLAPLQEGLLFHHLADTVRDPYLQHTLLCVDTRAGLDRLLDALQAVIARHDILRTAIVWERLSAPMQVVWRHAPLSVQEHPWTGSVERLREHVAQAPMSLQQAPLLCAHVVHDRSQDRWLLGLQHHHMVMDHTTLELAMDEIQTCLAGHQDRLPPPLPFRDFIAHAQLGMPPSEHQAFFTQMLADIDVPTAPFGLPTRDDALRDSEQAHLSLDDTLAHSLRSHARRMGVSVASLFHVAYALVVARSSDRDTVVFGTVLFGRMWAGDGADRVLGMFLNTLPLRLDCDATGIAQAIEDMQHRLAQLLRHEHAPLALAQRCSGVQPPAPLFTAVLNYRHASDGRTAAAGPDHAWDGIASLSVQERTHYALLLSVNDQGDAHGFSLDIQAMPRVGAQRAGRMMLQALAALDSALRLAPTTPLQALDVLPQQDIAAACASHPAAPTAAAEYCVHQVFEQQVARSPESIAVHFGDHALSYAQLNVQANRLAHHLIALGVRPDSRVALCLERGPEMMVGVLAVLKAGAAYVPLDPSYPAQRLAFMLEDSAPHCVLSHTALSALLPTGKVPLLWLDDSSAWAQQPERNPDPAEQGLCPHHLAYVIYTSGSSGRPKGVMVQHAAVVNLWQALDRVVHGDATSTPLRVSVNASLSFDASVKMWVQLLSGDSLVIVPQALRLDGEALLAWMRQSRLDVLDCTPAQLQLLLDHGLLDASAGVPKKVLIGGEAIPPAMWQRLSQCAHIGFFNVYGPTECTVDVTVAAIQSDDPLPTLGRPLANVRLSLLDRRRRPVPAGVVGELMVGGVQVARGYLHRPALTAECFVPDPFAERPGQRMYRTGDLARWRSDGALEFIGRNDHQIKLRGFRIELGDIQAALLRCDGVREAAVIARDDDHGDIRLIAYWVGDARSLSADGLRAQLSAELPDYMVPTAYRQLEALPLNANGKLDRQALPLPDAAMPLRQGYVPPANAIERALAKLWASVLGPQRIGRDDHFFELGGHSLSVVRLIAAAKRSSFELTVQMVYQSPTLRAQAAHLTAGVQTLGQQALAARRGGTRPALFVLPTGVGDITYAFELAAYIDTDIPVYALPWPDPLPATLEALAAHMVELIQAVQPHGPYHLLGYSSGGLLAYAIAQHLGMHDQPVGFLGLLDCDVPAAPTETDTLDDAIGRTLLRQLEGLQRHRPYQDRDDVQDALRSLLDRIGNSAYQDMALACQSDPMLAQLAGEEQTTVAALLHSCVTSTCFNRLWPTFAVQPLPTACRLHLFQATEPEPASDAYGWQHLLSDAQIERIPVEGEHTTLIEAEHIAALARRIEQALDSAARMTIQGTA